jgi:hypothetical protein
MPTLLAGSDHQAAACPPQSCVLSALPAKHGPMRTKHAQAIVANLLNINPDLGARKYITIIRPGGDWPMFAEHLQKRKVRFIPLYETHHIVVAVPAKQLHSPGKERNPEFDCLSH